MRVARRPGCVQAVSGSRGPCRAQGIRLGHLDGRGRRRQPSPLVPEVQKRQKCKTFVKYVNYNHMMPTRYQINDLELKKVVNEDVFASKEQEGQKPPPSPRSRRSSRTATRPRTSPSRRRAAMAPSTSSRSSASKCKARFLRSLPASLPGGRGATREPRVEPAAAAPAER